MVARNGLVKRESLQIRARLVRRIVGAQEVNARAGAVFRRRVPLRHTFALAKRRVRLDDESRAWLATEPAWHGSAGPPDRGACRGEHLVARTEGVRPIAPQPVEQRGDVRGAERRPSDRPHFSLERRHLRLAEVMDGIGREGEPGGGANTGGVAG